MFKKMISVLLAVMMVVSVFAVSAISFNAVTLEDTKLYFDIEGTGWTVSGTGTDVVSFYVYTTEEGGIGELIAWGGKKLRGALVSGETTVYEYDPAAKGMALEDGTQYAIIFYSGSGETYGLLFDTTCLGHIARCNGTTYENPVDSSQKSLVAFWDDLDPAEYGPRLQITSTGNVVGTCLDADKTSYDVFKNFLVDTGAQSLSNARAYTVDTGKKTEQKMIDDIGADLELTVEDVQAAFTETGVETTWSAEASTLPKATVPTEAPTEAPTDAPTEAPTDAPTEAPTDAPTEAPTEAPPIEGPRGDADGNNILEINDVTIIERYLVKLINESDINLSNADADLDGVVDVMDATLIQRVLAEICNWDKIPANNS